MCCRQVGYGYDLQHFGSKKVPPAPRRISQGPGDGTVNLRSLKSCVQLGPMVRPRPWRTDLQSMVPFVSSSRLQLEVSCTLQFSMSSR